MVIEPTKRDGQEKTNPQPKATKDHKMPEEDLKLPHNPRPIQDHRLDRDKLSAVDIMEVLNNNNNKSQVPQTCHQ